MFKKFLLKTCVPVDRSYHIFYFMITHKVDLHDYLSDNIYDYPLMSMGKVLEFSFCPLTTQPEKTSLKVCVLQ
jgi:ABC-type dipeptide/oligopeptide/nickel transport system ATPase subunit